MNADLKRKHSDVNDNGKMINHSVKHVANITMEDVTNLSHATNAGSQDIIRKIVDLRCTM